ncbi:MAG: LysR family transcriptional regulator [Firmicutes bacterium]|nr:LysR family transcriptional regulator [Bacillota bacterium]
MNLNYLQTLLAVQKYGNFSAAARQIGLTQPAVSLQIQALEEDVGTQLVVRDARTCELTPAGLALVEFAEEVFERLRQTRVLLSQLSGEVSGLVRLGASNIPGEYILPPMLKEFLQVYPQVSFSLEISDSEQIYNWLESKRIDFGIVGHHQAGTKYQYAPLANDELLIVIPADHPWAGQIIEPKQLYDYPFISREIGSGTRAHYEKALQTIGIDPAELNTVFTGGSTSAVLTAVLAGLGYAFCSQWALRNGLLLGELATARIEGLAMKRDFYVVSDPNRFRTLAVDELLKFLQRQGTNNRGGKAHG